MYRSSFRTFPSFLNPRAHSAHNTWTTFWSFRSFSSKTQSSFILSTITEQWKYETKSFHTEFLHISKMKYPFWIYPYKLWLQCSLTIKKFVSQKLQNRLFIFFLSKRSITKNWHSHRCTRKQNRCGTIPAEWNLDLNRCTCNDKTLSANWQVGDTVYVPIALYNFEL